MQLSPLYKVVAVVETALEQEVLSKFVELGARSYTWFPCTGRGKHVSDEMAFLGHSQIRVEVVAHRPLAEAIMEYLHSRQFSHRAILAYLEAVEVADPNRFQ